MNKLIPLLSFSILLLVPAGIQESFAVTEDEQITAGLDAAIGDEFGTSVSISGNTAIVGAPLDDDNGDASGSAYVFTRTGDTWTLQQKLTASDGAADDEFGTSVSISDDTVIVGSPFHNDGGSNAGSAYVFTRSGSTWTEQQEIEFPGAGVSSGFGTSVSISDDTVIVSAPTDADTGHDGSAYVFTRSGSTWTEQQKLIPSDAVAVGDNEFGESVSIWSDNIIVGADGDDDGGFSSGAAYVFTRSGSTWTEQQKLTSLDATSGDQFGSSVSIYVDTVIVGADGDDDGGDSIGSAYVFTRSGNSWTQLDKIRASDAEEIDRFGSSVSIYGDFAIVGNWADDDGGTSSGSAYLFEKNTDNIGDVNWIQKEKLTASDVGIGDNFGRSVFITDDASIVGAPSNNHEVSDAGAAYIFDIDFADLSISKSDDADPVSGGATIIYTITVRNAGPDTAENVKVEEFTEDNSNVLSTLGCDEDPTGVPTCTLGDIAPGNSAQFTVAWGPVTGTTGSGTVLRNEVSVFSTTTDPDLENNFTFEDTDVVSTFFELSFNAGTNVMVESEINMNDIDSIEVTFPDVPEPGGTLLFDFRPQPPLDPPKGFNISGQIFDISTDIPGPYEIILVYDDSGLTLAEELELSLRHYNEIMSQWEDQTTEVDPDANELTAIVDSSSPFGLFLPDNNPVGGELIPIEQTSIILAGTQMTASWLIPVIVSAIGIGIVFLRRQ